MTRATPVDGALETVDGAVKSIVYRNDETGYSIRR